MNPSWKQNLFFLCLAQLISMIGMSFFLPFIPLYLRELGMTSEDTIARWSGLIFASGFFMLSLFAPLWGMLADRYGRKLMVMRSMGAAALILFLTVFVQEPYQLLILRLLHGCLSGFVSSAVALIASDIPAASLGLGLGLFQSTITGGLIIGPLVGGYLADQFGIRWSIGMGSGFIFMGFILVALFVKDELKHNVEHSYQSAWENAKFLFKNATLWPTVRIQFLSNFSLMAIQPILALFVMELARGSHERLGTLTGLVISSSAFSMMLGAPFWGRIGDKWGQKKVLILCFFAAALTFIPQGLASKILYLALGRFVLGFFMAGLSPSLQALISHHSPPARRAGILGVSFAITLMGNALGPLCGGFLGGSLGLRSPFFMTAILLFMAGVMSLTLKTERLEGASAPLTDAD